MKHAATEPLNRRIAPPPKRYLAWALLLVLTFAPISVIAQYYNFDFGADSQTPRVECPAVVFVHDGNTGDYELTTSVAGPVFDDALEYSRQLCETSFSNPWIDETMGFFHVSQYGQTPNMPMGDVDDKFDQVLGCGKYSFYLDNNDQQNPHHFTVYLNLTDVNWATGPDNHFRNILLEPDFDYERVRVYISVDSKLSTALINCGWYNGGSTISYWELVRKHGGTWSNYARDRGFFSIDPSYTGPNPNGDQNTDEIPYGITDATFDVDVWVKDDIVVPNGKTLRITTDPDVINSPSVEQTEFLFYGGTGLTIEDGGYFVSTHSGPYGVVDYYCYTSTDKGSWTGIVAEPGSEIILGVSTITDAVVGVTLDDPDYAILLGCGIDDARDIGLWIKNCDSYPVAVNVCGIAGTGDYSGNFRTRNVLIENCTTAPHFWMSGISSAIKDEQNRNYFGGHGVEITGSSEVLFEECSIATNDSCGFFIHETVGPYILSSRVHNNGRNSSGQGGQVGAGIYVFRGTYWTTLRESTVDGNSGYGIYLSGTDDYQARIRGWWHPSSSIDPNTPSDVDQITDRLGRNCIHSNTHNVWAKQMGRFDLGSEYMDGSGSMVTLGGINSIYDPITSQGKLDFYSFGGFREDWWNNDPNIWTDHGSQLDNTDELQADSVGCSELGKRSARDAIAYVREMIEHNRTRGGMQTQPVVAEHPVRTVPSEATCAITDAYPNPFNPVARITMTLTEEQDIRLFVIDMLGREVAVLANGMYAAGIHGFTFDAGSLGTGSYLAVLRGATSVSTMPLMLAK